MKRYSFVSLAGMAVLAFVVMTIFQAPLSAQDVLAKAMENYESEERGIYHEKILREFYENNELTHDEITEFYRDEFESYLDIRRDPTTEEIRTVHLTQVDSFGDIRIFDSDPTSKWVAPPVVSPEQQKWLDVFKGEKVYCVEKLKGEYHEGEVVLALAAEDFSIYQLTGTSQNKDDGAYDPFQHDIDKMLDLRHSDSASRPNPKDYIEGLIQKNVFEYQKIKEEGKYNYLFKIPGSDTEYWFYIDSESYQLVRYDTYSKNDKGVPMQIKNFILESEHIDQSQREAIFNPVQFNFPNKGEPAFEVVGLPFSVDKSGCYDFKGALLEEQFFNQLPDSIEAEWNDLVQNIQSTVKKDDQFLTDEFDEDSELPFDLNSVQMPSRGDLIQGYKPGHKAWDFTLGENEDKNVYSVLGGLVIEIVDSGDWNGGYGNSILISHENGLKTFYAHLDSMNVQKGQMVQKGNVIGTLGSTGRVHKQTPQLHFEVRQIEEKIDPSVLYE